MPGDPDDNFILSAVPAFGGIELICRYPTLNPHAVAFLKLFRATSPLLDTAFQIGTMVGSNYMDRVDNDQVYYYWIQWVSINGTLGGFIGPASAQAKALSEDLIQELTGRIDAGVLSESLKAKLDELSVLNQNLINEIVAREDAQVTLAEAIQQAHDGIAEAHTFLAEEANSRVSADAATIETINLLAASLGSTIAAVETTAMAGIDALTGQADARWTAKVTVNDLVGGFALGNDGREVQAGFDVDLFWVGRTSANKTKPFIVSGDTVYLDKARIRDADIDTLKIQGNAVTVPVAAQYGPAGSVFPISATPAFAVQLSIQVPPGTPIQITASAVGYAGPCAYGKTAALGVYGGFMIYYEIVKDGSQVIYYEYSHDILNALNLFGGTHQVPISATVIDTALDGGNHTYAMRLSYVGEKPDFSSTGVPQGTCFVGATCPVITALGVKR